MLPSILMMSLFYIAKQRILFGVSITIFCYLCSVVWFFFMVQHCFTVAVTELNFAIYLFCNELNLF